MKKTVFGPSLTQYLSRSSFLTSLIFLTFWDFVSLSLIASADSALLFAHARQLPVPFRSAPFAFASNGVPHNVKVQLGLQTR